MPDVTYSLGMSLDGYVIGPDGRFDWSAPGDDLFSFLTDELRSVGVHLMGRKLYETMLYWNEPEQNPALDAAELRWAEMWNRLPKVVFSTTLTEVRGTARLATHDLKNEIERLRNEVTGDIAIGGAQLAAEAAGLDLIDEYRVRVYPVLVGGGTRYFAHDERRVDLDLVESRTFSSNVLYLRYRVTH